MPKPPIMTRRSLAAWAASAALPVLPAAAPGREAMQPGREPSGLQRSAEILARVRIPRDTYPAVQFVP